VYGRRGGNVGQWPTAAIAHASLTIPNRSAFSLFGRNKRVPFGYIGPLTTGMAGVTLGAHKYREHR